MELVIAILIAVLFGTGIYMILERRLMRVVLGTCLVSHGTLLFLITAGRLKRGISPIILDAAEPASAYVDPVPQALILTAIVIGFATTAFALVLAYKMYGKLGTDDLDKLRTAKTAQAAETTTPLSPNVPEAPAENELSEEHV
jgi:multicomponent Na+:H+ antiporter subunit C